MEADGSELAEIAGLVTSGKLKPHIQKIYPLRSAVDALVSVEVGQDRHDSGLIAASFA